MRQKRDDFREITTRFKALQTNKERTIQLEY